MRLRLGENIPLSAKTRLMGLGFDTDTVLDEAMGGRQDVDVWQPAQAEGRFFLTQDVDFSDVRKFFPGWDHGVMIVRLLDTEQWCIGDYLTAWFSSAEAASWERCFVVATPNKVRVLGPVADGSP